MEEMRVNLRAELDTLLKKHNETCGDMMEESFRKDLEDLILQKMQWAERRGQDRLE